MEKIKYYLVLEKRLGDYNLIDVNKLDICEIPVTNDIASIDSFTSRFSENEIKSSIERSNMVHASYVDGNLKVISDVRHNLRILTREVFDSVIGFQTNNESLDQNFKNKLYGAYKKTAEKSFNDKDFISGILQRFKAVLKSGDKHEIFRIIEELPYTNSRSIYFMIFDENMRRNDEKSRKLEKLNEAA